MDEEISDKAFHGFRGSIRGPLFLVLVREDHSQAWAGNGPQAMASLRNLALGLFRMKNVKAIKETAEWVCRDQTRALQFMTT